MIALLLSAVLAHAQPCPDQVASVEAAEAAIEADDVDALYDALDRARQGLACGPILDNPIVQARFWLARAVLLDAFGDVAGADDALYAAWRANPQAAIAHLPRPLRLRYARVVDRITEDAAFRLQPTPDPGSVIYVDGVALQVVKEGALEGLSHVSTQAGLHIIQVTPDVTSLHAVAARVRNLQAGQISQFDIHEEDLVARPPSELVIQPDLSKPASSGCAARRR